MSWVQIHITCAAEQAETIGDQLLLLGAQAVTFQDAADQPIYEPTPGKTPALWHHTIATGLFDEKEPLHSIIDYFEKQQAQGMIDYFHVQPLANQDWVRLNLDSFQPIQIGKRLCICPSWITPPHPDIANVILDPGLAFGTGSHPTTALCLQWLEQHLAAPSLVIDYGCGSGILSLAALKLGAQSVIAIDHDPQALIATQANAERNQITPSTLLTLTPEQYDEYKAVNQSPQADLLVANILAQPLIELSKKFYTLVKPHGKIVISGLLESQVIEIIEVYRHWFALESPILEKGWACLVGTKINFTLIE